MRRALQVCQAQLDVLNRCHHNTSTGSIFFFLAPAGNTIAVLQAHRRTRAVSAVAAMLLVVLRDVSILSACTVSRECHPFATHIIESSISTASFFGKTVLTFAAGQGAHPIRTSAALLPVRIWWRQQTQIVYSYKTPSTSALARPDIGNTFT